MAWLLTIIIHRLGGIQAGLLGTSAPKTPRAIPPGSPSTQIPQPKEEKSHL